MDALANVMYAFQVVADSIKKIWNMFVEAFGKVTKKDED